VRAVFEHIVPPSPLSWRLTVRSEPRFGFQWHFHREFELTLITKGSGTRMVGDCIEDYEPGDLVLIGPEVPHTYVSTPGHEGQEAIVVQFRPDFLGADFFGSPEFSAVAALLERASRGVSFPRDAVDLRRLGDMPPAERTLELLRLLVRLSGCEGDRLLAGAHHAPKLNRATQDRMDAMVTLMHAAYTRRIGLNEVAEAAYMAPSSASRFFRRTAGMTITDYLNLLRVNAACHLLRDGDGRIVDIAVECGYSNLSNFNRRFRALKGMTPSEYRQMWRLKRGR
jgi:AraC-like DNA-binding protein